jgi:hypothetical protein
MAAIGDTFRPGGAVPQSGIYLVTNDPSHAQPHDVTCAYGETVPVPRMSAPRAPEE